MVLNKKGKGKVKVYQNGKRLLVKKRDDKQVFDFNPYGGTIRISFFDNPAQLKEHPVGGIYLELDSANR